MGELCVFNGVDGETGGYLLPPTPPGSLPVMATGPGAVDADRAHRMELQWRHRQSTESTFAPIEGIDPTDIADAGWGVVVPIDPDPVVMEALEPLLRHRRAQAEAIDSRRYRVLDARPGESKSAFLRRHGAGPGPADPDVVPYYLMLVGDPESIGFGFQYQLDVSYAVGRISFAEPEDYARYAESVVRSETEPPPPPGSMGFFAPRNPDDPATALSLDHLVDPLIGAVPEMAGDLTVETVIGGSATADGLRKLLAQQPSLLFTASHGLGLPSGHPRQRELQGALVCQDWPGPTAAGFDNAWCFTADDVDPSVDLTGLIAFHFACYGAGTPRWDDYVRAPGTVGLAQDRREIAPAPFLAALPNRLLANPAGGALAAVGHVDRAWGYSFAWPDVGRQTAVYEATLRRLLSGHPLGSALEYFNQRYAELASDLLAELEEVAGGMDADDVALAAMWTARNDARGFTIVGDPAVRLAIASDGGVRQ